MNKKKLKLSETRFRNTNQGSIETFFTWRQKIAVKNVQYTGRTFYVEKVTLLI